MGKVILGTTMSLDGFMSAKDGDLEALGQTESLQEAIRTTGAVVLGRRAYAMADDPDWFVDNYEFQTPIFVLTHHVPEKMPKQSDKLTFTYVTDGIESAINQAKIAAGDKNVTIVGGASTAQQCLRAGLFDELHIDLRHILLGEGLRFFDDIGAAPIELENIGVSESPGVTHLTFRVVKSETGER